MDPRQGTITRCGSCQQRGEDRSESGGGHILPQRKPHALTGTHCVRTVYRYGTKAGPKAGSVEREVWTLRYLTIGAWST